MAHTQAGLLPRLSFFPSRSRVRRNAQGALDLFPNQSSGVMTSVVWGDGLVDNPAGTTIKRGSTVRFISLAELLS